MEMYPNGFPGSADDDGPGASSKPNFSLGDRPPPSSKPTFSEMALEVVRDAHPEGLTQDQIAAKIGLRYKAVVSPDTARVSMIRHRKFTKAHYTDGKWFYIPFDQRPAFREREQAALANGAGNGQVPHE